MNKDQKLLQDNIDRQLATYKVQLNQQVNKAIHQNIKALEGPHLRALKTFKESHEKMLNRCKTMNLRDSTKKRMISSENESYIRRVKSQMERYKKSIEIQLDLLK
jgi:hypothetical protein